MGAGAASGVVVAALGYAKAHTTEDFDPAKFIQTVVVGAVVGGIAGEAGMSYEQAQDWASTMGVVTLTEYIKKAVWRAIKR
jgi:hypothetical protein